MNLRGIKKDIEYVLGAFIEDCSVVATVNSNVAPAAVGSLMEEAIDLYNELRDKVNAKFEGSSARLTIPLSARRFSPRRKLSTKNSAQL